MKIARELRDKNIAEYLLYMWQLEDTLRAYGCDADRLRDEYVARFDYSDADRDAEAQWLADLCTMMREEGVTNQGHLQMNKGTLSLLTDLHLQLLQSSKHPFYSAAYYKALPYIVELRSKGSGKEKNEIENCVDALYGATVLKMQGRELTDQTKQALQPITHLLEMLSNLYKVD